MEELSKLEGCSVLWSRGWFPWLGLETDGATTLLLCKRSHFADTLMEMFEFREMKLEVNL